MATTRTKPTTAWEELAALDAQIEEARQRESEAEATRRRRQREVDARKAELAAYFDAVEAESRPANDADEAGLIAAIRDAEAASADSVGAARIAAARTRRETLESELQQWGHRNLTQLVTELAPRAVAAKEQMEDTYEAHRRASAEFGVVRRLAIRAAEFGGLPPEDVPANPDQGDEAAVVSRYARGAVELPLPRTLMARREAVGANG